MSVPFGLSIISWTLLQIIEQHISQQLPELQYFVHNMMLVNLGNSEHDRLCINPCLEFFSSLKLTIADWACSRVTGNGIWLRDKISGRRKLYHTLLHMHAM